MKNVIIPGAANMHKNGLIEEDFYACSMPLIKDILPIEVHVMSNMD